jgi:hypothetical protein
MGGVQTAECGNRPHNLGIVVKRSGGRHMTTSISLPIISDWFATFLP